MNQTMDRMFECGRCVSAHIERKKSKCDYRFHRPLSHEEIRRLEAAVNRVIQEDMPVRERFVAREACRGLYDLTRLPEGAGDEIRIVEIGDYDVCPCVGPHVRSTSEIGAFRITTSDCENGTLRIRYKLKKTEK